jgi:ornithine cyclodeaminase/alanine dehydrogenase-like protein (mu-crystallin family)
MDGSRLTLWRTAAASALAARYLARPSARRLLLVGTGALAPFLVRAHAAVRPIEEIAIWGRRPDAAEALAAAMRTQGLSALRAENLPDAVGAADIISCATLSPTPVVSGDWLSPGSHLDLVGAFTPTTREADDAAVRRARLFVDTRAGALHEAGDLVMPLQTGVITQSDIVADLFELCGGRSRGRGSADEITLFKSVGTALEDLAAAILVQRLLEAGPA